MLWFKICPVLLAGAAGLLLAASWLRRRNPARSHPVIMIFPGACPPSRCRSAVTAVEPGPLPPARPTQLVRPAGQDFAALGHGVTGSVPLPDSEVSRRPSRNGPGESARWQTAFPTAQKAHSGAKTRGQSSNQNGARTGLCAEAAPGHPWAQGADRDWLERLLGYWADGFDWRRAERGLNRFAHYRTRIGQAEVHFVHERARRGDGIPLVLGHGWPSCFAELLPLVPLLTDPGGHGIDGPAFDVVIPRCPATVSRRGQRWRAG